METVAPEEELPPGRTLAYQVLRVCERFSKDPEWFARLERQDQIQLLAYNSLREQEDMKILQAQIR